ncbi:MAG TPA: RDD family protein [Tepidisphaeraceae bacterium]|jgi:uncharacterized RDD family membrane protein YckC
MRATKKRSSYDGGNNAKMPRYQIITPEHVAFHYELAGLVSRGIAWLFDQMLIIIIDIAIMFAFGRLGSSLGMAAMILCMFVVDFSYFTASELYYQGQTPGKKIFHIRVISSRGTKLRFAEVLIRNLLRPVDLLPWAMVVGSSIAFIDKWHRRLGDIVADTIVVRDTRKQIPQTMAMEKSRVNSFQSDPALRNRVLSRITREERDMIIELALRRDQMEGSIRHQLFNQAAAHFRSRLSLPENLIHLSDEQTVINLALLIQETKFTG